MIFFEAGRISPPRPSYAGHSGRRHFDKKKWSILIWVLFYHNNLITKEGTRIKKTSDLKN